MRKTPLSTLALILALAAPALAGQAAKAPQAVPALPQVQALAANALPDGVQHGGLPAAAVVPTRIEKVLNRLRYIAAPPVVEPRFNDAQAAYYTGLSFDNLKAIV